MKFKTADGDFDVERFKAAVRIFITAQEIIVDNASYPIKEIAENSHIFRTLGLGYANLGSLIMSYGYGYDSVEGRALCGAITSIMTGEAYAQSARMARTMGPFPGYRDSRASGVAKPVAKDNVAPMLEVIELHRCAVHQIPDAKEFAYLKQEAASTWDQAANVGNRYGYRGCKGIRAFERGSRKLGTKRRTWKAPRLSQRTGNSARANGHDQLPDGLRHHRDRTGHCAGEIQASRRRRHAENR